jgi:hypothetical protein
MGTGKFRRSLGAGVMAAGLGILAGCSSFTAEDFKAVLDGVTQVAQAGGQYEAARRQGRPQANAAGSTQVASAGGQQQAQQQQAATYGALQCATLARRNGALCMENGCGRNVVVHSRSGAGPMGSVMIAPGQCMPIVPGTAAAVACSGGDRFDWGRSACVGS